MLIVQSSNHGVDTLEARNVHFRQTQFSTPHFATAALKTWVLKNAPLVFSMTC
jgi:hypothetical protein